MVKVDNQPYFLYSIVYDHVYNPFTMRVCNDRV